MAAIAKTQAQVVTAWEAGISHPQGPAASIQRIELAAKTPGVDGWTLLVVLGNGTHEVWTVT